MDFVETFFVPVGSRKNGPRAYVVPIFFDNKIRSLHPCNSFWPYNSIKFHAYKKVVQMCFVRDGFQPGQNFTTKVVYGSGCG